jgi:hypothetical protein
MKNSVLAFAMVLCFTVPAWSQGLQNPKAQQETPATQEDLKRVIHNTNRQVKGVAVEIEAQIAKTQREEDAARQKATQDQLNAINAGQEKDRQMLQEKLQKERREDLVALSVVFSGLVIILVGALAWRTLRGRNAKVAEQGDEHLIEKLKRLGVDPKPSEIEAFLETHQEAPYVLALPNENLYFSCVAYKNRETGTVLVTFPDQTGGDRRIFGAEKARKTAKRLYGLGQLKNVSVLPQATANQQAVN